MVSVKPLLRVTKILNKTSSSIKKLPVDSQTVLCKNNIVNLNIEPAIKYPNQFSINRIKNIINIMKEKFIIRFIRKPYGNSALSEEVQTLCKNINIKEIATEANFLGEGANGRVYRIPNLPYAIKIPTNYIPDINTEIAMFNNKGPFRMVRDKVNFIEARFGQCKILKYIEGVPVRNASFNIPMNPEAISQMSKSINELSDSTVKKYYLQILEGKRQGLGHDFVGNNCVLNIANKDITAIDFDLGRKTFFLESFIFQCGDPKLLNKTEQNNLFKKGLRNLLELIQEGKVLSNEVDLSGKTLLENAQLCCFEIKDINYFNFLCKLCDDFSKNKSFENINNILSKL